MHADAISRRSVVQRFALPMPSAALAQNAAHRKTSTALLQCKESGVHFLLISSATRCVSPPPRSIACPGPTLVDPDRFQPADPLDRHLRTTTCSTSSVDVTGMILSWSRLRPWEDAWTLRTWLALMSSNQRCFNAQAETNMCTYPWPYQVHFLKSRTCICACRSRLLRTWRRQRANGQRCSIRHPHAEHLSGLRN